MLVPVIARNGNFTPGFGFTPNMKSKSNAPLGVRPSPSRLAPGGATPLRPTFASHGPNTCVHPDPLPSYAASPATLAPHPLAATATTPPPHPPPATPPPPP